MHFKNFPGQTILGERGRLNSRKNERLSMSEKILNETLAGHKLSSDATERVSERIGMTAAWGGRREGAVGA